MTLPLMNFAVSPAPFDLTGALLKAMQANYQGAMANKERTLLPEEVEKAQLENKWYGPKMQSDIGLQGAQAGLAGAEADTDRFKLSHGLLYTPEVQNLMYAQHLAQQGDQQQAQQAQQVLQQQQIQQQLAQLMKQGLPNTNLPSSNLTMPNTMSQNLAQMMGGQASQLPQLGSPSDAYNANQTMPSIPQAPAQSAWNPASVSTRLLSKLLDPTFGRTNGNIGVGAKNEQFFEQLVGRDNPQLGNDPDKIFEASNVLRQGGDRLADGTPLNPLSPASLGMYDTLTKSQNTAQGINQQRFAATLDNTFKVADKHADQAFEYAALAGKTKGGIDQLIAQTGKDDPRYSAYRQFIDEDAPAMATEIGRATGANSTDHQKAIALAQVITSNITTNTKLAKDEYNELKTLYRNIGQTISKGPSATRQQLRGQGGGDQSNNPDPLGIL